MLEHIYYFLEKAPTDFCSLQQHRCNPDEKKKAGVNQITTCTPVEREKLMYR